MRALAWEPSLKPFLNLRGRDLRYCMRPVPVVRLLRALALQLSARGGEGGKGGVSEGPNEERKS